MTKIKEGMDSPTRTNILLASTMVTLYQVKVGYRPVSDKIMNAKRIIGNENIPSSY